MCAAANVEQDNPGKTYTLEDLAFEEGDSFDMSAPKSKFKPGHAYQVHIKGATVKETKNGYLQVELDLEFAANGDKAGKQWAMLPVFTKAMASTLGQEALHKKKQSFGKSFMALLRACDPDKFNVYSRVDKSGRPWKFYGSDGNLLTNAEKLMKEKAVARSVVEVAVELAGGGVAPFIGTEPWLVIVESPSRDASRPEPSLWANWYDSAPDKYPQAQIDSIPF